MDNIDWVKIKEREKVDENKEDSDSEDEGKGHLDEQSHYKTMLEIMKVQYMSTLRYLWFK